MGHQFPLTPDPSETWTLTMWVRPRSPTCSVVRPPSAAFTHLSKDSGSSNLEPAPVVGWRASLMQHVVRRCALNPCPGLVLARGVTSGQGKSGLGMLRG